MAKKKTPQATDQTVNQLPDQTSVPTNPYIPSRSPGVVPNATPNNNALAPNTRADYKPSNDQNDGMLPFAKTPFPSAAGASATSPSGNTTITGMPDEFDAPPKISTAAIGNSGTQIFGGYFSEDYLHELTGRRGAKIWDEMRRSEAQISMLMNAVKNPIKSANWNIEPYDLNDPECVKHAELCDMILNEQLDINTFKHEALTFIEFGFAIFEPVHNVIFNHPKFGTFNGLKCLAFRSQKTIENWQLEQKTGKLIGVNQYTYSDLGGNQFIPGEFCLVFTLNKEGDNYEGISALRPMYGPFLRKNLYLKLAAIGIEKYAVGTPVGTIPKGKERAPEADEFKKILQNYTSHELAYLVKPEGWTIDIQRGDFDAGKIKEMLTFENTEIANCLVANFLALGMNGNASSLALGSNLLEFFTTGIQSYADIVSDGINRGLFPSLVKLNFGPQRGYPKLKITGITDKAGKELAETIKFLTDSRALDPDMPLKEYIRKQFNLPKPDTGSAEVLPFIPAGASANYPKSGQPVINPQTGEMEDGVKYDPAKLFSEDANTIKLADKKYVAKFDKNKAYVKQIMQDNLFKIYDGLKDELKKKYNSLSGTDKILAAKNLEAPGVNAYAANLRECFADIAAQSIADARKMVPSKKNVKLDELDTNARKHIKESNFALPKTRQYPIHDIAHARNALARSSGKPEEAEVRAAVYRKYPELKKNKKLSEGMQLSEYDALPPYVRKLIDAQAALIANTQAGDIEKQVFFSFTSSATTEQDIGNLLNDVDETVLPSLEGGTKQGMSIDAAAGDAVGHVTQQASLSFLFDDEVIDGIESFTFTNEDPVSDICNELAGTTWAVGDGDIDAYTPPLHHNCKSRLVPNLKGESGNPEIDRGGVSLTKKALDSITLHECRHRLFDKK